MHSPSNEPNPSALRIAPPTLSHSLVPDRELSYANLETLRLAKGADLILLYDVSPSGAAQATASELERNPRIVVADHHGAFAPTREEAGREMCAAEVVAEMLPRLERAGVFAAAPRIHAATTTGNLDPDAIVSRALIETFMDGRRAETWNDGVRELLIGAARFGDTTLFGGVPQGLLDSRQLSPHARLALAILQGITEGKEEFAAAHKRDAAYLSYVICSACPGRLFSAPMANIIAGRIEAIRASGRDPVLHIAQDEALSDLTLPTLADFEEHMAQSNLGPTRAVLRELSRAEVRSVFVGKAHADLWGGAHAPYWNPETIERLSAQLAGDLPALVLDDDRQTAMADRFLADLALVRARAVEATEVIQSGGAAVAVTEAADRLDFQGDVARPTRQLFVYDWLREASAAFGGPWLHIMERSNGCVVSSRFAAPGEERPEINLNTPEAVRDLTELEAERARAAGEDPCRFLIKANLWLPLGRSHLSPEDLSGLVFRHFDSIVNDAGPTQRVLPRVQWGDGSESEIDGAAAALRHLALRP